MTFTAHLINDTQESVLYKASRFSRNVKHCLFLSIVPFQFDIFFFIPITIDRAQDISSTRHQNKVITQNTQKRDANSNCSILQIGSLKFSITRLLFKDVMFIHLSFDL